MISTNEKPLHEKCPPGADSWCKWQAHHAAGKAKDYDHPTPLYPKVQKHVKAIYEDLSRNDLLERCLGGHNQNKNESFNALVWRLAPKHLHAGTKIVEIAAFIAAITFNDGFAGILKVMQTMELKIGQTCKFFCDEYDDV